MLNSRHHFFYVWLFFFNCPVHAIKYRLKTNDSHWVKITASMMNLSKMLQDIPKNKKETIPLDISSTTLIPLLSLWEREANNQSINVPLKELTLSQLVKLINGAEYLQIDNLSKKLKNAWIRTIILNKRSQREPLIFSFKDPLAKKEIAQRFLKQFPPQLIKSRLSEFRQLNNIHGLAYNIAGDQLAFTQGCRLDIWDQINPSRPTTLGYAYNINYVDNTKLLLTKVKKIWVADIVNDTTAQSNEEHSAPIWCMAYEPLNQKCITGCCKQGDVKIWDINNLSLINSTEKHEKEIFSVAVNPIINQIAYGEREKIHLIDDRLQKKIHTFIEHTNSVFALVYNKDSQLISGSYDHTVGLWDLRVNKLLKKYDCNDCIQELHLLQKQLLLVGLQNLSKKNIMFQLWDLQNNICHIIQGPKSIECFASKPDNTEFAVGTRQGIIDIYSLPNEKYNKFSLEYVVSLSDQEIIKI